MRSEAVQESGTSRNRLSLGAAADALGISQASNAQLSASGGHTSPSGRCNTFSGEAAIAPSDAILEASHGGMETGRWAL